MCLTDACLLWMPEMNCIRTIICWTEEIWGWDASNQECTMPYMRTDPAPDISVFLSLLLTLFFFLASEIVNSDFPCKRCLQAYLATLFWKQHKTQQSRPKGGGKERWLLPAAPSSLSLGLPPHALIQTAYLRHSSQHVLKEWFFKSVSCHCETD